MNKWKLIKKEKNKRLRFDWAENLEKKSNANYFSVNISTPPFYLDLWVKDFKFMLAKYFSFFSCACVSHCSKITKSQSSMPLWPSRQ